MALIYREETIREFFNIIYPDLWNSWEAAFVSLAARKKYLPEDSSLDLGHRPEMLDRNIVRKRDVEEYVAKIRRFDTPGGYTCTDGTPIPQSAMAVYVNIHLSDCLDAWKQSKDEMSKTEAEMFSHAARGGGIIEHALRRIRSLDGIWLTKMQNSYSRKQWIDYDLDLKDGAPAFDLARAARSVFSQCGLDDRTLYLSTRGGWHILLYVKKAPFSESVNPESLLTMLRDATRGLTEEVIINRNGMVPLPGTVQGGHCVAMYRPEDLEGKNMEEKA